MEVIQDMVATPVCITHIKAMVQDTVIQVTTEDCMELIMAPMHHTCCPTIQELTHHSRKEEKQRLLNQDTDSLPHSIAKRRERSKTLNSEMKIHEFQKSQVLIRFYKIRVLDSQNHFKRYKVYNSNFICIKI
jgi:hypothetical protein